MPNALLLGGTGFVGRHVGEKLQRAGVRAHPRQAARQSRGGVRRPVMPLTARARFQPVWVEDVATGQHPGLSALSIRPASVYAIGPTYLGQRGARSGLLSARARR